MHYVFNAALVTSLLLYALKNGFVVTLKRFPGQAKRDT